MNGKYKVYVEEEAEYNPGERRELVRAVVMGKGHLRENQ